MRPHRDSGGTVRDKATKQTKVGKSRNRSAREVLVVVARTMQPLDGRQAVDCISLLSGVNYTPGCWCCQIEALRKNCACVARGTFAALVTEERVVDRRPMAAAEMARGVDLLRWFRSWSG